MFTLEQAIGVGGMGAVFRALDNRLERQVALKILPPEQANDSEVVQRFYQEGRAAARLDHENIARVYTIGNDGRYHYIAFEYIEGATIRQRVEKNGPLPVGEAINFTLQIADALVHASERGVVHRDIKPSNIIVTPHGRAKLVDMGLARRFERGGDDGLTQSGMTLGTFDYISPEQARDPRGVDVRSDLYSLGCTLFHMLTGRPPFPDGTVLQKLIQHQEETPPDVRVLNPAVPQDLASILVKMMAKDRDRRYQTPEQLVRDLLTVAGALGLRSVSPEGLVWLASDTPSVWERHLVWGFPALVFSLIVSALLWWGRDPGTPSSVASSDVETNVSTVASKTTDAAPPRTVSKTNAGPRRTGELEPPTAAPAPAIVPRDISAESTEELVAAIANAPPRSVIVLTSNGPYQFGATAVGEKPSATRWTGRDLTIRADTGVRPVLKLARELPSGSNARPALLDFVSSHVTIEGLEFVLEPGYRVEPLAAIRVEDSDLTVRRCLFRRPGGADPSGKGLSRVAAIEVKNAAAAGLTAGSDRPPALIMDKCHVDGAQVGVLGSGAVDVSVRDCTLATTEPAFWLDNARSAAPIAGELRLRHLSVMTASAPVFRFEGTAARVWLDDAVVAPTGNAEATLVASDTPETLVWHGRANLYTKVGTFLKPLDPARAREAIRDATAWKETSDDQRESGSVFLKSTVWAEPDPSRALVSETLNPTRIFRLAAENLSASTDVGVRQGPFGTIGPPVRLAANYPSPSSAFPPGSILGSLVSDPRPSEVVAPATGERPVDTVATRPTPAQVTTPPAAAIPVPDETPGDAGPGRVGELPEMPVMPPAREKVAGGDPVLPGSEPVQPAEANVLPPVVEAATNPVKSSTTVPPRNDPAHVEIPLIRTADQLQKALSDPQSRAGLLRIAADADWELPGSTIRGTGSWRIQAEAGKTRPKLRFLPAATARNVSAGWAALFALRSGSLQLEGIDVILPRANAPRQGRWAAFWVRPGTYLNLVNCTVTIEGDQTPSAMVAVTPTDHEEEEGVTAPEPLAATIQASDSLFRVGGDLVDVAAGKRLVMELNDALVATGASLIHAHGLPRGQTAERLNLTIRQLTARLGKGLVLLETAPGEPELPVADINARDSIFATSPKDAPLISVDGQDAPASMRDRIVWEGHGVGYHQISTYRRDQSAQLGSSPTLYDRPSWVVAVGSRELAAFHGDLKFQEDWDDDLPAWSLRREDALLSADSPLMTAGCDQARIPNPPPSS